MSEITLHVSPSPSAFFRQTAIIHCTAFSNTELSRWWSATPEDANTDTLEQIPPLRLYKLTRDYKHRELKPEIIVVCALVDGRVVGCATWRLPKRLWRSESLAEIIYRKVIESKDAFEDWLFPSQWHISERREEFETAQDVSINKFLGPGTIDDTWYLKILAVHPEFQGRGIGTALLDWGLNHARERGEKVYLEATPSGEKLYLKKGFQKVGDLTVGREGEQILMPCMLWGPVITPSQRLVEQNGNAER
jgi:GNAT superfamily N-acetyltransferase